MTAASAPVGPFTWRPRLPGDKSITHRAYLLALLAGGRYRVTGANPGEDCAATLAAVEALGVPVSRGEGDAVLGGIAGAPRTPDGPLDLGNSGTGLRLLAGAAAGCPVRVTLTGDASLCSRPMDRVLEPLAAMGAEVASTGGHAPLTVTGGILRPYRGPLIVPSAQVKSAILLAGVRATGETRLTGTAGTRDHTERLLRWFGADCVVEDDAVRLVPGPLTARDVAVPGDPSAAAFAAAAAAIVPGSDAVLEGVSLNPTRTAVFDVLERFGARVDREPAGRDAEPRGTVRVRAHGLRGLDLDPGEVVGLIDELPVLAVVAAFAEGATRVRGAGELRVKESDRLAAMASALRAVGADCEEHADGWTVRGSGGAPLAGGTVRTHGDHRVGMAALVAGLHSTDGVRLEDDARIATSDPYFLSNLNSLMERPS